MSNVAFGSRKKTFWSSLEQAPSGKFRDSSPPSKAPRHRPVSGAPSPGPLRAPPHSRPCSNPPHPEHSYLLSRAPLAVARGRRIWICFLLLFLLFLASLGPPLLFFLVLASHCCSVVAPALFLAFFAFPCLAFRCFFVNAFFKVTFPAPFALGLFFLAFLLYLHLCS